MWMARAGGSLCVCRIRRRVLVGFALGFVRCIGCRRLVLDVRSGFAFGARIIRNIRGIRWGLCGFTLGLRGFVLSLSGFRGGFPCGFFGFALGFLLRILTAVAFALAARSLLLLFSALAFLGARDAEKLV